MSSQSYMTVGQDQQIEDSSKLSKNTSFQFNQKQQKLTFLEYVITYISQALTLILIIYLIYLISNVSFDKTLYFKQNTSIHQQEPQYINTHNNNLVRKLINQQKLNDDNQSFQQKYYKQQINSQLVFASKAENGNKASQQQINNKNIDFQTNIQEQNIKYNQSKQNPQTINLNSFSKIQHQNNINQNQQTQKTTQGQSDTTSKLLKQKYPRLTIKLAKDNRIILKSKKQQNSKLTQNIKSKKTNKFIDQQERQKIILNYIQQTQDSQSIYLQLLKQNQQINPNLYSEKHKFNSVSSQEYEEKNAFCVIVSTSNNNQYKQIIRMMNSIYNQEYKNYHTILVDRSSSDDTVNLVNNFVSQLPILLKKTKVAKINSQSQLQAIGEGLKYCNKGQIAILINGNSQLLSKKVFKITNTLYQKQNPKIVYSDSYNLDFKNKVINKIQATEYNEIQKQMNLYREAEVKYGKYFTFSTDLLTDLNSSYLVDSNSAWFRHTGNQALLVSLLELSCGKISHLNEPVIFYQTTQDGNSLSQIQLEKYTIATKSKIQTC